MLAETEQRTPVMPLDKLITNRGKFIVVALAVSSTHTIANQNREAQRASCVSANDTRAASVQVWNYLLDSSEQNNPTKKDHIEQFRVYMHNAYAPRDCDHIGS